MTTKERELVLEIKALVEQQPQGYDPSPDEADTSPEDVNYFLGGLIMRRIEKLLGSEEGTS